MGPGKCNAGGLPCEGSLASLSGGVENYTPGWLMNAMETGISYCDTTWPDADIILTCI